VTINALPQSASFVPKSLQKRWALTIVIAAVVFRVIVAWQPGFNQADEIWQYVEPAWGWATGHWVQTWEFHVGLRGWLIPMLFRPVLAAGHALAPGAQGPFILLRLIVALLALVIPYAFWRLGSTISPLHGIVAGWVGALWPEAAYFSARTSGENLATIAVFAAIVAIYEKPAPQRPAGHDRSRLIWIGLCLTLGVILRFQYLPALGLLGLAVLRQTPGRGIGWLLAGVLGGLALGGAADQMAGQPPFGWLLTNLRMNFSENRSAVFGTDPAWWYLGQIGLTWSLGMVLILPGILMALRRFPLFAAMALVTLLSHSLIPHKEYRFILLAQLLLIFMGAIGSLDLVQALATRWKGRPMAPVGALATLCGLWFAAALLTAVTPPFVDNWGNGRAISNALALAGQDPGLCGVAVYRAPSHPFVSYALLGRNVPLLLVDGPNARLVAAENAGRFNAVFAQRLAQSDLPQDYKLAGCQFPGKQPKDQYYCVFRRAGTCTGGAGDLDYNAALTRLGH
jgi:hypothetical protein